MHVLEHPVQCGVEKSCRPAALRPESHQLRALRETREHCPQKTTTGQKPQGPEAQKRRISFEMRPSRVGEGHQPTISGASEGPQPVPTDLG